MKLNWYICANTIDVVKNFAVIKNVTIRVSLYAQRKPYLYFQHHSSKRGQYRVYDSEELTRAYQAVKDNTMSIRRTAQAYGIPKTTLIDRLHGCISVDVVKSGTLPLFSLEEEALLAGHLNP